MKSLPGAESLDQRTRDTWLEQFVEQSLATNKSTFALLPVSRILDPKGVLAALEAKGYAVEQPDKRRRQQPPHEKTAWLAAAL